MDDGDIYLRCDNGSGSIDTYIQCIGSTGAVNLAHYGSTKLETTSSGITVTGDVNSTSDITMKSNVETLQDVVSLVKQLNGVKFTWKDSNQASIGVIAQELETVLPELVQTNSEGLKTVTYNGLIGVLIEAIKEQQTEIDLIKQSLNKI